METLRSLYPEVPGMEDFCAYWINRAHNVLPPCAAADPFVGRAGLVDTQNIRNNALEAKVLRKPATGGNREFNKVNMGLLVGHGIRGGSLDMVPTNTGAFQTYSPVHKTGEIDYDWLWLSECDFGSPSLRWMRIYACNMLRENM